MAILPSSVACLAGPRLRLVPLNPAGPLLNVGVLFKDKAPPLVEDFVQTALSANSSAAD